MLKLGLQVPRNILFRTTGFFGRLPMSLTVSLSYRCNSRCATCNISRKTCDELSLEEWKKIFASLGTTPGWVTFSGGEPFLKNDLFEIVSSFYDQCHPAVLNIPTNGLLQERIVSTVERIARYCEKSQVVINLSLDDVGGKHDAIRGVQGNYQKAMATWAGLRELQLDNLTLGIHTVVSRFNVHRIPHIYEQLIALAPDSYITEIAEQRVELGTEDAEITPSEKEYARVADFLADTLRRSTVSRRAGRLTRAFRIEYYRLAKRILAEQRQVIPCYAGIASAQISPDGQVWMCCVRADPVGELRETNYDFKKIWFSPKAQHMRKRIKDNECSCPLANAAYTNMLHHPPSLIRVFRHLFLQRNVW